MLISPTTFAAEKTLASGTEEGTVEVTIGRETRRVPASFYTDGTMVARGMTGRYRTGGKAWPATIMLNRNSQGAYSEFVWFGRDDRSGRFNKANCLFFA